MSERPQASELPFLLRLLDDDSPAVRPAVVDRLAAFGGELGRELANLPETPGPETRALLKELLAGHNRAWLREAWSAWFGLETDIAKLESALTLLAEFQGGRLDLWTLPEQLDGLVFQFRRQRRKRDPVRLAEYLFGPDGLAGAGRDYHNPDHSSLTAAIHGGRGLPITLTLIYMLMGHRLGLDITGCSFPGHFLARAIVDGEVMFVDCYHGGRLLTREDILEARADAARPLARVLDTLPSAEAILLRVLNNLVRAYSEAGRPEDAALMGELAKGLHAALARGRAPRALPAGPTPRPLAE